jgi:hypothetical protein
MRISEQWKAFWLDVIDGVQGEVGMPVPALNEFRSRLDEAAATARSRKHFADDLAVFLDSQAFLREAQARYLRRKVPEAMELTEALVKRVQEMLPKYEGAENESVVDETTGHETEGAGSFLDVSDAIKSAEQILAGHAAAEGKSDPRWQAIMKVEAFVEEEPDAVWPFIVKWGSSADQDLRAAVATLLLEDLLEYHFDRFFPRLEEEVQSSALLADTFLRCWKLGQAGEGDNALRFDSLQAQCRKIKTATS